MVARLVTLLGLFAAVGLGTCAARARYLPSARTLPGLRIDGAELPAGADLPAFVASRAHALESRRVTLFVEDEPDRVLREASLVELGLVVDQDTVVREAERVGHDGDLLARIEAAERARRGDVDVPLLPVVKGDALMAFLTTVKEATDTQPVSARLDLDRHGVIPEKPGRYLDAFGGVAALELAARDPLAQRVKVPVAHVAPRMTSALVSTLDVHAVVSEYETYFSRGGDQARRGKNIDVAASRLDGVVLSPGELVSFNQIVGDRSEENGFQKSWEIFKGEMIEGIGGGTCQVASTFHAIAFFAGLDIVERLPHSRPSAYIPMGLDSTVVYPIVDLKVRNPHPFPVVLHAKTQGNKLKMELLGPSRPVRVAFGRELLTSVPYPRKVVEKSELSSKKIVVKQHGIRGFKIRRSRLLKFADGTAKKEENTDFYPPTTEIYEVPVGFDVALLPPLPEEAGDGDDGVPASRDASTPTPSAAPVPSTVPCAGDCPEQVQAATDLQMVDAPGAHAPTGAQANPAKSIWLRR